MIGMELSLSLRKGSTQNPRLQSSVRKGTPDPSAPIGSETTHNRWQRLSADFPGLNEINGLHY
jgi:hypothetical protein